MKFGKQIQKKQLEIPEYASSFVDYKALKKLIKELKNSPVTRPNSPRHGQAAQEQTPQQALQANRAPFFFRLDRELDKVNVFYTVKEAESRVRLRVLIDKLRSTRVRNPVISRNSTHYVTLEQGFRDFIKDLGKLQQFIEINATAFSKILKKWDKTSKSQTKELYLSRAIEVQPCFNRDVISELSDQATASLLDCAAWAEGEGTQHAAVPDTSATPRLEQLETDSDLLDTTNRGDIQSLRDLLSHFDGSESARDRVTKTFLTAVSQAPVEGLKLLLDSGMVDLHRQDEINDRNCLHKSAMMGRRFFLQAGVEAGVDPALVDAYGRIPLHYASMNGHVGIVEDLVRARPDTLETPDLDNFTPLIHAIVHDHLAVIERLLLSSARVDALNESGHPPLNLACQWGSIPIVDLLLRSRPQIMPDAEGLFPQHLVARFGRDPRLLLLLRDYGADLDQPDKLYQWTPLFHAASEGRLACLQTLLECGVNPDTKDEKGNSALYYATWEGHTSCMATLAAKMSGNDFSRNTPQAKSNLGKTPSGSSKTTGSSVEMIPDLSLPPPIIPTRRYGHNFLDTKTTVFVIFEGNDASAVRFYDESKYPAARLTIAPKVTDILPRNLLLPIQDDNRVVSFESDNLSTFSLDFDVYPTFGKKVIAKGSVPAEVFQQDDSSGRHHLSLFDPRLRPVGQLSFRFQVVKPFAGVALNVTPFATYWKATSQFDDKPSSFVTGSSLSGDYIRIPLQISKEGVPVVYPSWFVGINGLDIPVQSLTSAQFTSLRSDKLRNESFWTQERERLLNTNPSKLQNELALSYATLTEIFDNLPLQVHLDLHIVYPTEEQEQALRLRRTPNINTFVDAILQATFQHARQSRVRAEGSMRSVVFTSYNIDICTALNWKQPNYPVLLCNRLGTHAPAYTRGGEDSTENPAAVAPHPQTSIKEAVRIATANNLMGLVCHKRLFDLVPALIEAIKVSGLILISNGVNDGNEELFDVTTPSESSGDVPDSGKPVNWSDVLEGIDGVVGQRGVMSLRGMEEV